MNVLKAIKWAWGAVKVVALAAATVWMGAKWVQQEFKVIAQDEVRQVESRLESVRKTDIEHIDKRFDRVERLIIERVK